MSLEQSSRAAIQGAHRLVVKIGSSSLTNAGQGLDPTRLKQFVAATAERRARGDQIIVVSSGAIAAGLPALGLTRRPDDLATQQAAASIGQSVMLSAYAQAFAEHGLTVGQVLLTVDDVMRRSHYRNAQRTLFRLLELGVVPIVNENDTVATNEIRLGDNDRLAALVAHLSRAEALILLSDVDALYDAPPDRPGAERITCVPAGQDLAHIRMRGTGKAGVGLGGMSSKVEAAMIASAAGVPALIAGASDASVALEQGTVGTVFPAGTTRPGTRHLWLEHAAHPVGSLHLDAGAATAVRDRGASLLPAGIVRISGVFFAGDVVDLIDPDGRVIARGFVNFDSSELPVLLGRSTKDLARELGSAYEREIVHRDDMVMLGIGSAHAE
jgi:glutamate 5-kinase